jgi:hypothetical protein
MFTNEPVPFVMVGNRRALPHIVVAVDPALMDFVTRFQSAFEYDAIRELWLLIEV